jgi:hypothetical protein
MILSGFGHRAGLQARRFNLSSLICSHLRMGRIDRKRYGISAGGVQVGSIAPLGSRISHFKAARAAYRSVPYVANYFLSRRVI